MGTLDRDYTRARRQPAQPPLPPVTKALLIANVAIFFFGFFGLDKKLLGLSLAKTFSFTIRSGVQEGRIWEFITFQFLHASIGHIMLNMFGLFFFGPWMERWWGGARYLVFYLLCGAAGAGFFTLLMSLGWLPGAEFGTLQSLVGASAGIYGIFIGVAIIAPQARVMLLIPPIELSMRQLAIGILVVAVGTIVLQIGENEGGEAGHLGGAILGFLLVKFPFLLGRDRAPLGVVREPRNPRPSHDAKIRPRTEIDLAGENEIDRILDKVSREGLQSLTDGERDTLRKFSEKHTP